MVGGQWSEISRDPEKACTVVRPGWVNEAVCARVFFDAATFRNSDDANDVWLKVVSCKQRLHRKAPRALLPPLCAGAFSCGASYRL